MELLQRAQQAIDNYLKNPRQGYYGLQVVYKEIFGVEYSGCKCKGNKLFEKLAEWVKKQKENERINQLTG